MMRVLQLLTAAFSSVLGWQSLSPLNNDVVTRLLDEMLSNSPVIELVVGRPPRLCRLSADLLPASLSTSAWFIVGSSKEPLPRALTTGCQTAAGEPLDSLAMFTSKSRFFNTKLRLGGSAKAKTPHLPDADAGYYRLPPSTRSLVCWSAALLTLTPIVESDIDVQRKQYPACPKSDTALLLLQPEAVASWLLNVRTSITLH
uniref:Secreted protein n=1 Tax=Haptolina ericina TaxID=156174 RepID=A0A7S3AWK7_9EUKA|mmetsp:Transcript_39791/g.90228  ORF Transcript_39791/g.90228 Transcript_39791/m.90228 type:complete len:201 (+) Transcript_39791:212-814(+)